MHSEIITNVNAAINTFIAAISKQTDKLLVIANDEREELLNLMTRMSTTRAALDDLSAIYEKTADALYVQSEICGDVASKIGEAMEEPLDRCPENPYEDIAGFCDECGEEILTSDHYTYDAEIDSLVCESCQDTADAEV